MLSETLFYLTIRYRLCLLLVGRKAKNEEALLQVLGEIPAEHFKQRVEEKVRALGRELKGQRSRREELQMQRMRLETEQKNLR